MGRVIVFFTAVSGVALLIDERRIERGDDKVARYLTRRLEATLASLAGTTEASDQPLSNDTR